MPRILGTHDLPLAARQRADQTDPLVQYIVVPRSSPATLAELGASVARACQRSRAFQDHPDWAESYAGWLAGSFRKITLRAKDAQFQRVLDEFELTRDGDVLCLPPRRRSQAGKLLSRDLQNLTIIKADRHLPVFPLEEALSSGMHLIVNDALGMSDGKLLAQIGHAAMKPDLDAPAERVHLWKAGSVEAFANIIARYPVHVVQDAGLTEIAGGSETVISLLR